MLDAITLIDTYREKYDNDWIDAAALEELSGPIQDQGYVTQDQLYDLVKLVEPRHAHHVLHSDGDRIERITKKAVAEDDPFIAFALLSALEPLDVVSAATVLSAANPELYGPINANVWAALMALDVLHREPHGEDFAVPDVTDATEELRRLSRKSGKTVRDVCFALDAYATDQLEDR